MSSLPSLHGTLFVPGDKSISHRALLLGAIAEGATRLTHVGTGEDLLSTIRCLRQLGLTIRSDSVPAGKPGKDLSGKANDFFSNDPIWIIEGKGLQGLCAPEGALDCGNSATTMRLLAGILAGQRFSSVLTGDASLLRRPMERILIPLSEMGAHAQGEAGYAPLSLHPSMLQGITYTLPVASAQVKSCLLLAGLYAKGTTTLTEPIPTRDHTERLLHAFGATIDIDPQQATIRPEGSLHAIDLKIPGDLSSAAYFLVAAILLPGSEVLLKNVGINPTRDGILQALQEMGADICVEDARFGTEPSADLLIRSASLHGATFDSAQIPSLIDEIPILSIAAACAEGTTIFRGVEELRHKESDRLAMLEQALRAIGVDASCDEDTLTVHGNGFASAQKKSGPLLSQHPLPFHSCTVDVAGDHRMAMTFSIASLLAEGGITISDPSCVSISYPGFYTDLRSLLR